MADRDERVLQERAHLCVRMDVPRRDGAHAKPPREPLERPVAHTVPVRVGALELDPQAIGAERIEQRARGALVVDAVLSAAGQADQALGVLQHPLERNARLARRRWARRARVRVGEREEPAEVASTRARRARAA